MAERSSDSQLPDYRLSLHQHLLPIEVALGLATAPLLVALVGTKIVANTLQDLGQWSEELLRGDRLPALNLPATPPPAPSAPAP